MLALRARLVYSTLTVFALIGLLIYSGCAVSQNPVTGRQRAYAYTWEQEQQLGQEADVQLQDFYGIYDEGGITQYTEQVGERVLAESHLRAQAPDEQFQIPFHWRVLDSPIVNAFALPGGYIYVSRGLLAHMNNEAQLAMVLGHEVGHVAARHASARAVQQQLAQIGLIVGAVAAQEFLGDTAGETVLGLGGVAAQLIFLSYSRDNERESDYLGVQYAARAGYVAAEGSEFFRSLQRITEEAGAGGLPQWASTHPDPGEREQTIIQLAEEYAQEYEMTDLNQEAFLAAIDGLVLGENPRQGLVEGGTFYHPNKRFQYAIPQDFETQMQPGQVVMVSPGEDAIMLQTFAQGAASAREGAADFAGQDGINVIEEGATQVGGRTAHRLIADAQTQDGTIRLQGYFIEHSDEVVVLLGYALQDDFAAYQDRFLQSMESFQEITDRNILDVEPDRLQVVQADRQAPFRDFLPAELPQGLSPEDLAILNQVELDETIEAGRPLKLPQ